MEGAGHIQEWGLSSQLLPKPQVHLGPERCTVFFFFFPVETGYFLNFSVGMIHHYVPWNNKIVL